ncbi:hypothetical protein DY000_02053251 [Brassica cretica]|uniref:Uncharacterized protein n=1 Tax=Brassica cretica TaxID=69181 RepID=A0ABQ7A865_BRACR|nr:hypothetical protein DY000_02053251 [Brassica cretica]
MDGLKATVHQLENQFTDLGKIEICHGRLESNDLYFDLTAKVNFGSHFGSIIEGEHLDGLYDDWTVEYDVETSLPLDDETHECVISGYCLLQGMRPHLTYSVVYS